MPDVNTELLIIGLSCLISAGDYKGVSAVEAETHYRLTARVGSAVNFHLPDISACARFVLTDPHSNNVVTVYNGTYSETDRKYVHRSITSSLNDGTLLLTLHKIQQGDNGTFLIRPGGDSPDLCWRQYLLMTYEDTWSEWSLWSDCSGQCGNGRHSRHRYCYRNHLRRVESVNCNGASFENQNCLMKHCATPSTVRAFIYQWTDWSQWSTCSMTCGHGFMIRDRRCHDRHAIIDNQECTGLSKENKTCMVYECENIGETSSGYNKSGADEKVIQLPLYSIVGAGAGVFILLLIIVICVLVIKLKKRGSFKAGKSPKQGSIRKKESIVSFSSQGVSGVHVYDEIDDARSQRMSVLTIDNPYVTMPKSPNGNHGAKNNSVAYSNTQEKVFLFDNTMVGGQSENRKVSYTYQNIENKTETSDSNKLTVPRHMSVDSTGYLMPGTALERAAARRNKKYTK